MMANITKSLFLFISFCFIHVGAYAYTSIASIPDHGADVFHYATNYGNQKEADTVALKGCRNTAKEAGLTKLMNKCQIYGRGKQAGYGAVSCGDSGCAWTTGYPVLQDALDGAYATCNESFKNCKDKDLTNWKDTAGFSQPKASPPSGGNCIPNSPVRRCSSQCTNGNCVVTYDNGCRVNVRVSPRFDPFSNQWQYPAPGC